MAQGRTPGGDRAWWPIPAAANARRLRRHAGVFLQARPPAGPVRGSVGAAVWPGRPWPAGSRGAFSTKPHPKSPSPARSRCCSGRDQCAQHLRAGRGRISLDILGPLAGSQLFARIDRPNTETDNRGRSSSCFAHPRKVGRITSY